MRKLIIVVTFLCLVCSCATYSPIEASENFAPLPVFETATVSWDPNTESDLSGYKIYYGTSSRSYNNKLDVGNKTSFLVNNLVVGTTYYFAVTAYDFSGNESNFSKEVSFIPAPEKPFISTIRWLKTEADTLVVEVDSSFTKVTPLKMLIKSEHTASMSIDSIQIDFNDRLWSVIGTVIFTKEDSDWITNNNKVSGIKLGDYYAVNTRVHALGGSWSDWGSPISKRFKIEVLDKIISEVIEVTIEVQIK